MGVEFSRRRFIVASALAGGGLALGFSSAQAAPGAPAELCPWITIGADDVVTVRVTTPDVGNGVTTNAAFLVAEELGCDWRKVRTEYPQPSGDPAYSSAGGAVAWFSGRSTLPDRMAMMLQCGASARERLRAAAATRLGVPVSQVAVRQGRLVAGERSLAFGEVAADAAAIKLDAEPKPKASADWSLLGKVPVKRLEQAGIVDGNAVYGIDVRVPGMVYAALLQSPVQGGRLKRLDADRAKSMPGVLAVVTVDPSEARGHAGNGKEPMAFPAFSSAPQSAVAVIAEHYWQARQGLEALAIEWDDGDGARWTDDASVLAAAQALYDKPADKPLVARGDIGVPVEDGRVVRADYQTPYCDHAPMEPLNGMARVDDGAVELWMPTQNITQSAWVAADEAQVPLKNVVHHQPLIGGAFGRRTLADDTRMVVAVARKFKGRPVKLIWSREEMTRQGRYRPYVAARVQATLGRDGMPQILTARIAQARGFPPLGLIDSPYLSTGVPNVRIESQLLDMNLLTGSFRGPSYNSFAFVLESFIDECAIAAKISPVDYRLKLLADWPDGGWATCLKTVAAKSAFGKPLPRGRGQGIALSNWGGYGKPRHGTTAAAVAEVEVSRAGDLRVVRIDLAFDAGRILNADTVHQQLIGAALFGLNVAVNEGLTIEKGRVVQTNFDSYPVRRIADTPDIHIHMDALSGDERFGEIGEVGVGPVGPAVANAIMRATGKRVRSQPFRAHDLSWT